MLLSFFTSPVGRKIIMSLTGLFLCSFIVAHLIGNLQIFKADHGLAFNTYTVFMTTNPGIITLSYMTYVSILLHAISGCVIEYKNKRRRKVSYLIKPTHSPWYARRMFVLGSLVFIYLMIHLGNFWYQYKFGNISYMRYTINQETGKVISAMALPQNFQPATKLQEYIDTGKNKVITVRNLYAVVTERFKVWWLVCIYTFGVMALAYHLLHGFQSAFRSLGLYHKKYLYLVRLIGVFFFAILVPASFISMPVYFFIKSAL